MVPCSPINSFAPNAGMNCPIVPKEPRSLNVRVQAVNGTLLLRASDPEPSTSNNCCRRLEKNRVWPCAMVSCASLEGCVAPHRVKAALTTASSLFSFARDKVERHSVPPAPGAAATTSIHCCRRGSLGMTHTGSEVMLSSFEANAAVNGQQFVSSAAEVLARPARSLPAHG
jgi:hypothetical protein